VRVRNTVLAGRDFSIMMRLVAACCVASVLAVAAAAQEPQLMTSSGSLKISVCEACDVSTVKSGQTCRLDNLCDVTDALTKAGEDSKKDLTAQINKVLSDLTTTTDGLATATAGLKKTSDDLVANMRKCAGQSPPTIYDEATKACAKGFGLQDIDECERKPSPCNAAKRQQCVNTAGSYKCVMDADECSTKTTCPQHATCTDKILGQPAQCTCKRGYSGDGKTCEASPAGSFTDEKGSVQECPKGSTSKAASAECTCDKGYVRDSKKACVPCAFRTYKETVSDTDKCKACPDFTTTHTEAPASKSDCLSMAWKTNAGDFNSLQSMLIDFPPTHYEYGTSYNTPTSRVVIAGFGENLPEVGSPRVMVTPFYPQTDHYHNQRWGTAMWTYGNGDTQNPEARNKWYHKYVKSEWTGTPSGGGGNGGQIDHKALSVRPFTRPWTYVGILDDVMPRTDTKRCALCQFHDTYPHEKYELGMLTPNMQTVQHAFQNGWSRGEVITLYPLYYLNEESRGDAKKFRMGTSVLTMNMKGAKNTTRWTHHFQRYPRGRLGGLQGTNKIKVYVRERLHAWVKVGTMKDVQSLRKKYSHLNYNIGIPYNGVIQRAFFNGWNRGTRMTLYPFYPQGGDEYNMQFGTALFTQGVPPESLTEKRWRHIYVRQNQGGDSEYSWASNGLGGSIDSKAVYVKRHEFPWKRVGKLADYDSISKKYPFADWEWGSTYNGDVQKMTMNGWNRGVRLALNPIYPMSNDNYKAQQMGTTMFIRGCHNCKGGTSGKAWRQTYYKYPKGYSGSNTDNHQGDFYVRRPSDFHDHILTETCYQ